MNRANSKILKEKMKDEEGGIIALYRLIPKFLASKASVEIGNTLRGTKLRFLPKFCCLDAQVLLKYFLLTVIFEMSSMGEKPN